MTTTMPCARGCARAGTEDSPVILPATHGRYCARCHGRIDHALIQAPELAAHILSNVTSTGGGQDERIDSSREAPLPFDKAAFADVNELYSLLVYWSQVWAEKLDHLRPAPAARAWRNARGTVTGLPAGADPTAASKEVARICRWLRDRLDDILTLDPDDVDEFDAGIRDVWRMNARWPRIERPRFSDMPCPRQDCGQKIAVYPPTFPGDAQRIVCEAGHWYPPEEFEHLVLVFQQTQLEQAQGNRVAARLARKYLRHNPTITKET